jgi:hypothetical protein
MLIKRARYTDGCNLCVERIYVICNYDGILIFGHRLICIGTVANMRTNKMTLYLTCVLRLCSVE